MHSYSSQEDFYAKMDTGILDSMVYLTIGSYFSFFHDQSADLFILANGSNNKFVYTYDFGSESSTEGECTTKESPRATKFQVVIEGKINR